MPDLTFETMSHEYQLRVEKVLAGAIPDAKTHPEQLHQAMRYATLEGGKRIRAQLVYATGAALGLNLWQLDPLAAAVELIHAYSLVHDDLPVMDNDDLRRGQPSCHKKFDEATAVLTGDALQTLAFQLLSHHNTNGVSAETRLKMLHLLATASVSRGMVGGQAIDLFSVGKELSIPELEDMHIRKTGALIRASIQLAALGKEDLPVAQFELLDHFGKCIGLAFQIKDDILDVEGDAALTGKTTGIDQISNKPTYTKLLGLEEAKAQADHYYREALQSIEFLQEAGKPLADLAQFVIQRNR